MEKRRSISLSDSVRVREFRDGCLFERQPKRGFGWEKEVVMDRSEMRAVVALYLGVRLDTVDALERRIAAPSTEADS